MSSSARATIEDVALRAGVSTATVSRVINKSPQVTEATANRVRAAIQELNYRPHAAARGLARRKTNTIGLVVSEISGYFFQPMLRGIEAGVREHGFDLLIYSTQQGSSRGASSFLLGEHNTDGILVFARSLNPSELRRLHLRGFPIALLYQSAPRGLAIPSVTVENRAGARRIVDYLIKEQGCRRIAFLRGPKGVEDSYWRQIGYCEALQAHQITPDAELIGTGGFNEAIAARQVKRWLDAGLALDAIFAGDDDSALGVMATLRRAGRRIPEDIAVVGFDDIPVAAYVSPALTTVRSPIEQVGYEAVQQLLRLIQGEEAALTTLLPCELVIRESCQKNLARASGSL